MDLTSGSVFTLNERDYVILEDTNKNGKHYLFVNKLDGEEPTKEYYCVEEENGKVKFLHDSELTQELLNEFIVEKLKKSSNVTAINLKKNYIDFLNEKVKDLEEKLQDEDLIEADTVYLADQKKTVETEIDAVDNLKTPTADEIAKMREAFSLELEYKEIERQLASTQNLAQKVKELQELKDYFSLRMKKAAYPKIEIDNQLAVMVSKLATQYPEICSINEIKPSDDKLIVLSNQADAIWDKITKLKNEGKDYKDLNSTYDAVMSFIKDYKSKRDAAIAEEENEFEKNKDGILIRWVNEIKDCQLTDIQAKIVKTEEEIKALEAKIHDAEAMLIVNYDDETQKQKISDESKLNAQKAKLKIYYNEINSRKFPKEIQYNEEFFELFIKNEKAKAGSLEPEDQEKRMNELKKLEEKYKRYSYIRNHDFKSAYDALQSKATSLVERLHNKEKEIIKIKNAKNKSTKEIQGYKEEPSIFTNLDFLKAKAIQNFQGKEFITEDIRKFLEEQEEFKSLKDHPDKDKIEYLLINEITNACKTQNVSNVRKNWKTYAKSAGLVTAGIATGLVLSSVPGVGTVRMIVAGAKLAGNVIDKGINIYNSKHKDKEPIRTISQVIDDKIKNSKILPDKIKNGLDSIGKILCSKNVNLFVNGVSVGYIAGNVIEVVTGKTVIQNISDKFNNSKNLELASSTQVVSEQAASSTSGKVPNGEKAAANGSGSSAAADAASLTTNEIIDSLQVGDVYDLSNITEGYTYAGSKEAVRLLTPAGRSCPIQQIMTDDKGTKWISFLQNATDEYGKPLKYAWIKADTVAQKGVLLKSAEEIGKGLGR